MTENLTELPATGGAYLLWLVLDRSLTVPRRRAGPWQLPAGHYAYCGSAYGPGGIASRVSRHLRGDKALRWHVDHLSAIAPIAAVLVDPGGHECDLVDWALGLPGSEIPVKGFGASDCRRCPAHLIRFERDLSRRDLALIGRTRRRAGILWTPGRNGPTNGHPGP